MFNGVHIKLVRNHLSYMRLYTKAALCCKLLQDINDYEMMIC